MPIAEEKISALIELLRVGTSIREGCRRTGINDATLYVEFEKDKGLRERVEDAKRLGYLLKADELLKEIEEFEKRIDVTHEQVGQWRAAFGAKQWLFSKVLPKIYGDKLEVSGNVTGPPSISINIGSDAAAKKVIDVEQKAIEDLTKKGKDEEDK